MLEEHTRERLAIEVGKSAEPGCDPDAVAVDAFVSKACSYRSDNGAEFTAALVMKWLRGQNVGPSHIKPGSPRQNGFVEALMATCAMRA